MPYYFDFFYKSCYICNGLEQVVCKTDKSCPKFFYLKFYGTDTELFSSETLKTYYTKMSKRKIPVLMKLLFVFSLTAGLASGCSETIFEEKINYNDITVPFKDTFVQDTVSFGELSKKSSRYIFRLDESSASIVDENKYSFKMNELIQIRETASGDSVRITSYSAQTIHDIKLEIYLPDADIYLPMAQLDSIPGFSQFEFKPSFIGKRTVYKKPDGQFISFKYDYLDFDSMKPRLTSSDKHFQMLQKIDSEWYLHFSNYDWKDESSNGGWREMRPIFAREWVVIMTNFAYMLTTPEYKHVMDNFSKIFGGDLYDNNKVPFTKEQYRERTEYFKKNHRFRLGRTGDQVSGLGGGSTLGIASYNFYGHYASYSGWEAVMHEFMHCMNYSHDSNMTYANKQGIGWTVFIWQLHLWLSRQQNLPYLDRHLLDFTNPEYAEYRDNTGIRSEFLDDAALEKKIQGYYNGSALVKYLSENPID